MYEIRDIFPLLGLVVIGVSWYRAQMVKEAALAATRRYCAQADVQLLEDAVVLRRLWLKRDGQGHLRLRRVYEFEFTSTGEQRYSGCTVLLGRHLDSIQLAPHRIN